MADKTVEVKGGIGFFGLLTLIFVVAKITGHIDWSWFWVFSPIIFSFGLAVVFMFLVLVLVGIAENKK